MRPEFQIVSGDSSRRPKEAILGTGYELLVDSKSTRGAYELMKFVVPPGLGPPRHMHSREDEHYYFLSGEFEVSVGEQIVVASAGTFLHLPRLVPHGLINVGEAEGSFLCWVIPGNLGELFAQFTKPWPQNQTYPPVLNMYEIERMLKAGAEFGITQVV